MKNLFHIKIQAFTLIELVLVAMIISLIMPSMFALYAFITRSGTEISARQSTIQQGYEFFERLNILMQDYTIDYEEYYNRQMVGCVAGGSTGSNFKRNIGLSGYCTEFTAYGNQNSTNRRTSLGGGSLDSNFWDIYYCSSTNTNEAGSVNRNGVPVVVNKDKCGKYGSKQSFGQYAALFTDVKTDEDKDGNLVGDGDDENLGRSSINAIMDADNIQEIYLISHDGKSRLYFRRKFIQTGGNYTQYKIQMLRLKGFDAGQQHNFGNTSTNPGIYDGVIDTRACDAGMGFEGHGDSLSGAYSDYRLPADVDDCWVDVTQGATTVLAWNIVVSPTTDSELSWMSEDRQINAYLKILTVNGIYAPYYNTKLSESTVDFKIPLETAINMKDFYRN